MAQLTLCSTCCIKGAYNRVRSTTKNFSLLLCVFLAIIVSLGLKSYHMMYNYWSQKGYKWSSIEKDHKHEVCWHIRLIMTLKLFQWISILVFCDAIMSSGYTMNDTKGPKSNFVGKSLDVDDLLIARNHIELLNKAKGLIII